MEPEINTATESLLQYDDHFGSSDDIIELSRPGDQVETKDKETDGYVEIITCNLTVSGSVFQEKLKLWREARQHTIDSLRELASYLDNVSSLTNMVVAVRGNVLQKGAYMGTGILTFAFGMSLPFLVAGAGIGIASFVSRVVGIGGQMIGPSLAMVGGVLTVVTAGRALPVVVAGCGLWFASGIARWVGAGGGFLAKCFTVVGGAVMVLTAGTALVVCLGGVGLWLAIPAITREIMGSRQVEIVSKGIGDDVDITEDILKELDEDGDDILKNSRYSSADVREVISGKVSVLLDGSPLVWDVRQLEHGVKNLVKDWKLGSTHIRVIADQLEEAFANISLLF